MALAAGVVLQIIAMVVFAVVFYSHPQIWKRRGKRVRHGYVRSVCTLLERSLAGSSLQFIIEKSKKQLVLEGRMAITYDIKWKNDLKMYMNTFKSFILEGNVNDLQPIELVEGFCYSSLDETIADMYSQDYCVVFYDHTKQSGKVIEDTAVDNDDDDDGAAMQTNTEAIDVSWFNSFTFYQKTMYSQSGERIASPNIELFKEYYKRDYLDKIAESSTKDMQGGRTIDIRRIFDVMNEFDEKKKDAKYSEAKPFMFILPGVSRYMTSPGSPDDKENAILMILFNATQIEKTSCKMMLFVDKINDLPAWFESESNNSAVKKLFIPTPDSKFRETFFKLEMLGVMDPIGEEDLNSKIVKFSAYTENYSLRRLQQLKLFIEKEADNVDDNVPSYRNISNIDKTVLRFDLGQSSDPWRDRELMERILSMGGKIRKDIQGQDRAIAAVAKTLTTAATGVKSPKKNDRTPRAIFFFAGPTGVGKTELAKQMSENIFQRQDSMIRFDMSEFREEHSDARLFGAPPGYVGYEAGGELTRAVKQNPFSVILFDEIEKASPRIWDKFLQILGDGRLTDGKGETVSFTQSIIVFTSNLGITADPVTSDYARIQRDEAIKVNAKVVKDIEAELESCHDEAKRKELANNLLKIYYSKACLEGLTCDVRNDYLFVKCYQELGEKSADDAFNYFVSNCVKSRIQRYFENIGRREVLGRIGDENILIFNFMSSPIAIKLADINIEKFKKYLKTEHDSQLDLEITDAAKEFIRKEAQKTEVIDLGGRGIVGCVNKLISDPIGDFLSQPEYFARTGLNARMDAEGNKLVVSLR